MSRSCRACVGLDELPDREAIGGLGRGDGSVFTHEVSL
jgi:hypothetical protein